MLQNGTVTYNFRDGVAELDNPDHTDHIRSKIGVCPQHNEALLQDLSCRETLHLFARLKGRIPKQNEEQSEEEAIEEEVERRLEDIAFTSEGDADKPIATYSGGMKRKELLELVLNFLKN